MTATNFTYRAIFLAAMTICFIAGCGDDKPTDPPPVLPKIELFTANPNTIIPPDMSQITWKAKFSDSVKLYPPGQKLVPPDSGQVLVSPDSSTAYTLIAFNSAGKDSAEVIVNVILSPVIEIFTANPTDIVPPALSQLTWKVRSADSLKLFPSGQELNPDSGQIYVSPTIPTSYSIVAYNDVGIDSANVSITMHSLAAIINEFKIIPDTIIFGDSATISWKTDQADSLIIDLGIGKVANADSGDILITPMNSMNFIAVAYSIYGNDTAYASILLKVPSKVRALNGLFIKAVMGTSQLSPLIELGVENPNNVLLNNLWITLNLQKGDGVLLPSDSVLTDSLGIAKVSYNFSGLLGQAKIRANFRDIDTVLIQARANTLIPGIGGQAQYILFTDSLNNVKNFNGNPESIDVDPQFWLTYANYESTLGVVFVIDDTTRDEIAQDFEDVFAIILTSNYTGKTKDSIGIGSTLNEIKAVYGPPDSIYFDAAQPPALGVVYGSEGLLFFIDTVTPGTVDTNTAAFEIHMDDFITTTAPADKQTGKAASINFNRNPDYRRYRK